MKHLVPIKNHRFLSLAGRLFAGLALGALAVLPLRAETVFVTTYTGSAVTVCDPFCVNVLAISPAPGYSSFGSTLIASPPGVPSRTKTVYFFNPAPPNWTIKPPTLVDGGIYRIETAHNNGASTTPDVLVTAWSNDGTVSPSCTNTIAFQRAQGGDVWIPIGYITNNPGVTSPTIFFQYVSGTLNNTGSGRLYVDAFKFTLIDPCDGVVADVAVTGPLAAGQTNVPVTGVTAGATNITIYANDTEIGQTNYAAGFTAGALAVPVTTALVKDEVIKATQSKPSAAPAGFCTSTYPSTGPVVGGGANPQLSVFLTCGSQSALTGPAGTDTSGANTVEYHVKCTGLIGSGGTAPVGGVLLPPGSCWQTATFDILTDPLRAHQSNTAFTETNGYCQLIALSFAIDSTSPDSGNYDIYVDEIKNGDVVIENFEGWADGTGVTFNTPNVASIPPAGATYLSAPNSALVSQLNAYEGSNSCRIQWQFASADTIRWSRVLASRSNGATYPQLNTTNPVTVRLLVLPVGETTNKLSVGSLPSQTNAPGSSVTFSITAKGTAPFTYQWKKNGSNVGTDSSSFTINPVAAGDAGTYTVVVDNADCDPVESSAATLTVQSLAAAVTITNISTTAIGYTGGAGSQFVLLTSSTVNAPMASWTPVATNTVTGGTFTTPGPGYYRIESK